MMVFEPRRVMMCRLYGVPRAAQRAASPEGGERPRRGRGNTEAVPCRPSPTLADARFAPGLRPARAGVLGAALQRSLPEYNDCRATRERDRAAAAARRHGDVLPAF